MRSSVSRDLTALGVTAAPKIDDVVRGMFLVVVSTMTKELTGTGRVETRGGEPLGEVDSNPSSS